jgi:hypothetical protein
MSVPAYQPFSPLGIPQKQQEKTQYSPWNPMGWYSSVNSYRQRLNLPNPGKFERLHAETKGWSLLIHQLHLYAIYYQRDRSNIMIFSRFTRIDIG